MKIWEILRFENKDKLYNTRHLGVTIRAEVFSDGDVVAVIDSSDCGDIPTPSLLEEEFSLKSILDAEFVEIQEDR